MKTNNPFNRRHEDFRELKLIKDEFSHFLQIHLISGKLIKALFFGNVQLIEFSHSVN